MHLIYRAKTALTLFGVLITVVSCITPSKIKYLQADDGAVQRKFTTLEVDYLVQKGDNLYIKISSLEPTSNQFLSNETTGNLSQGIGVKYKDVYLVDAEGYIKLPQMNKLKVDSLSLKQISDTIDRRIQRLYPQTYCQVRLADNYVTIIGDVNNPGRYMIDFSDKITIFELIGMAGDLSYEAKRNDIKLIRKKGNETEIISVDLTKRNILESNNYYILPNDVVYVEPLKAVSWHQRSFPFATSLALLLSTTTTILVIISYFK